MRKAYIIHAVVNELVSPVTYAVRVEDGEGNFVEIPAPGANECLRLQWKIADAINSCASVEALKV